VTGRLNMKGRLLRQAYRDPHVRRAAQLQEHPRKASVDAELASTPKRGTMCQWRSRRLRARTWVLRTGDLCAGVWLLGSVGVGR